MSKKRQRYAADFKAKVALEAIRGELTVAQIAAKHGIQLTMMTAWKKQAIEGISTVFAHKTGGADKVREAEVERLHAKIGRLVVERDPGSGPGQAFW